MVATPCLVAVWLCDYLHPYLMQTDFSHRYYIDLYRVFSSTSFDWQHNTYTGSSIQAHQSYLYFKQWLHLLLSNHVIAHTYKWNGVPNEVVVWVGGYERPVRLWSCEKVMRSCAAQCEMLFQLFCCFSYSSVNAASIIPQSTVHLATKGMTDIN